MKKTCILIFVCSLLVSCNEPKYQCADDRATYFDQNGRVVKTNDGISDGYVLIPAAGDAGSFMLGTYVRIQNGKIVERYKGRPKVIEENTIKPWREKHKKK